MATQSHSWVDTAARFIDTGTCSSVHMSDMFLFAATWLGLGRAGLRSCRANRKHFCDFQLEVVVVFLSQGL